MKWKISNKTVGALIGILFVCDLILLYLWTAGSVVKSSLITVAFLAGGFLAWHIRQSTLSQSSIRPGEVLQSTGTLARLGHAIMSLGKRLLAVPSQYSNVTTIYIFAGAAVLYSFLSPLWVDQDSLCALGWSIRGAKSIFSVYQEWSWGPSFYAPGPVNSWLLLMGHPIFKALGYTFPAAVTEGWGFNPFTLYLYKWIQGIPFVLGTGFLFYRMFGNRAAALFLFNPATLWFIILGGLFDNMYAVFFLTLGLFFLQRNRMVPFILAVAFALMSKQTIMMLIPVLVLMLFFSKGWKAILYLGLLYAIYKGFIHPYKAYDLQAYISHDDFWVRPSIHYGFVWAHYFFSTPVFAACWMALLLVKRPRLNLVNFSMWTIPLYMVYTIGAGFYFEKFIYSAIPMMLVVTMFLYVKKKKAIVWLFLAITLFPVLTQIWVRTGQPDIVIEPYTNYWNVTTPIRVKPNLRPEVQQPGLLVSSELGVMLAFMIFAGTSLMKKQPNVEWKGRAATGGVGKRVVAVCVAIFLAGTLYTYSRSGDWIEWKEFQINGEIKNSRLDEWIPVPLGQELRYLPDFWRIEGAMSSIKRIANANSEQDGKYSVQVVSTPDRAVLLTQEIPIQSYCGGIVKVSVSVWADKPRAAMVILNDGAAEVSSYHSGSGSFEDVSASFKVENTALLGGRKKLKIALKTSEGGNTAIFSNMRVSLLTRQTLFPVQRDALISFPETR